jgi:tetratricopeptide (TPR) repeat protein
MRPSFLLSCLFLPLFFVDAQGQSTTPMVPITPPKSSAPTSQTTASAPSDYSAEPFVVDHMDAVYKMAADGTGSKVTTVAIRVQSDAMLKQVGVLNIPFASGTQHLEILYARVKRPDGTVIETPIDQAIEMPSPVTTAAPFYSDLKQMQLPVRSLRVGDTLEWKVKLVLTKPEAPGQFWGLENFDNDGIVLSQSIELRVPKDTYVNVWSHTNKPTETVDGGERVFRWVSSQLKPTVGKEADAAKELKKKQAWTAEQELDAKEEKLPSIAWTTFKSWEAVGAWYQGLESDRIVPDAAVKAKVAELTAGKTTEEEKVRAVYGYVATQIRYIGVAFGIGRYQPHHAGDVLENQYGDCKDKHTLLAAMLSALGLHPNAVLIGAGVRFNEAVPSPGSFNHLITTVMVNGEQVWLDTTAEVAPYRALVYVTRDKKALVVPDTGVAKIETTPAALPFPSYQKLDAVGTLDREGTANLHLVWTMRGDGEMILRGAFRQVSPGQYDEMVQQISKGMGWQGETSHAEVSRPEETATPMTWSYNYKREKSGDWDDLKIIAQLAPVELPQVDEKEPPVQSINLGVPGLNTSTFAMKLPEGWSAVLPEPIHTKSSYATFDESYRFEKGTLYAERRIEILKDKVPVAEWKTYKEWVDKSMLTQDRWVQLATDGNKAAAESTTPRKQENAEAAKLIQSAVEAIERRDIADAKTKLDQAKELNPDQPYLWFTYGYYYYQLGGMNTAIQDYHKELALYPERIAVYKDLVRVEASQNLKSEMKETLKEWAAADSRDPVPCAMLAEILLADGDAAAALPAAESAVARLPEDKKNDERSQLLLGQAQLGSSMKQKGHDTLLALMKNTHDPMMMNDVAYVLADASQELSEDETVSRKSVEMMTAESKTWTLDDSLQALAAKSRQLAAVWDTLGWILYREGKLDEAEGFLKAAWVNTQSDTVAEHVGQLESARGEKNEALTTYRLGIAASHPGTEQKKLQSLAEALQKAGAKSPVTDSQKKLQEDRKISLGPAKGLDGVAEYKLLLNGDRVVQAKKTGDKDLPGGEERLKEAKLVGFLPAGSEANLMRGAMLNCHSGVCELVLMP